MQAWAEGTPALRRARRERNAKHFELLIRTAKKRRKAGETEAMQAWAEGTPGLLLPS